MQKKLYSDDWNDKIRPTILKRDNYRCVKCGIQHKRYIQPFDKGKYIYIEKDEYDWFLTQGIKVMRVYLHVCHLDHNKDNNNPDNLVTMCVRCHAKNDAQRRALMRIAKC